MFKVHNFFQNYKEGNRRLSFTLFWYQINFKETLHSVVHYVTLLYITLRSYVQKLFKKRRYKLQWHCIYLCFTISSPILYNTWKTLGAIKRVRPLG